MALPQIKSRRTRRILKTAFNILIGVYLLAAALILGVRFLVLPHANDYKDLIAEKLSSALGAEVAIGELRPSWDSYWPHVSATAVTIRGKDSASAVTVPKAEASLDWKSLWKGMPVFARLSIESPSLSVVRTGKSTFSVGGFDLDLSGPGGSSEGLRWLMNEGLLQFSAGSVLYRDATAEGSPEISLQNGTFMFARTVKAWNAGFQGELLTPRSPGAQPVDFRLHIPRTPVTPDDKWEKWHGTFYASVKNICVPDLLSAAGADRILSRGTADAELWLGFENGDIREAKLLADTRDAETYGAEQGSFVPIPGIRGLFSLGYDEKSGAYSLKSSSVRITPEKGDEIRASLNLRRGKTEHENDFLALEAEKIRPEVLTPAILKMLPGGFGRDVLEQMAPEGNLTEVRVELSGDAASPERWSAAANFSALKLVPMPDKDPLVPGIPGGTNLSGRIEMGNYGGVIRADSSDGTASFPGIFPNPEIPVKKLTGTVFFRTDPALTLSFRDMRLENQAVSLHADADWTDNGSPAGRIEVSGTVSRGDAENVYRYVPSVAGKSIIGWLEESLRGGTASGAAVEWRGDIDRFPYTGMNPKTDCFIATGHISDATLDFLPSGKKDKNGRFRQGEDWPVLSKIKGDFLFEADRMVIAADSGTTPWGTALRHTVVWIPGMGFSDSRNNLHIYGEGSGEAQPMLEYVKRTPVSGWLSHFLDPAKADGKAGFTLFVRAPFDKPEKTLVSGEVKLDRNAVSLGHGIPEFRNALGTVRFTQSGYSGEGLSAEIWGIPAKGELSETPDGGTLVTATARAGIDDAKRLSAGNPVLEEALKLASGSADASVRVLYSDSGQLSVSVKSDLKGISANLPAPLEKNAEEARPAEFMFRTLATDEIRADLFIKDYLSGAALLKNDSSFTPEALALGVGAVPDLPKSGISVRAVTPKIDADLWRRTLEPVLAASKDPIPGSNLRIEELSGRIGTVTFSKRAFKDVGFRVKEGASGDWNAVIDAKDAAGTVRFVPGGKGAAASVTADLSRLRIPEESKTYIRDYVEQADAGDLPALRVKIASLKSGGIDLGKVRIEGAPKKDGWALERLTADNGAASVSASGLWNREKNTTSLSGELGITDTALLFKKLALPKDVIRNAPGTAKITASWKGAPRDFALQNLNGTVSADIGAGQFLQVDPGVAGRFLSLISMQALVKRLTLDFRDVLGKGFAFDHIEMDGRMKSGVLSTENLQIRASAATIVAKGSMNLPKQTVDASVLVLPGIHAEGPALALALANPLVGIGGFIASYVLSNPISHLLATEYTVRGPLDNPEFTKGKPVDLKTLEKKKQ